MINLPWYDPDPRRALFRLNKEVKEEDIVFSKEGYVTNETIKSSPISIGFAISTAADSHLKLLMDLSSKFGIDITREQIKKLHAELLSLHYFLNTFLINKRIKGDQFTLFVLRTHVALLDILPKVGIGSWLLGFNPFGRKTKTEDIEMSISGAILEGENFYLRNELNEGDKRELASDLTFFEIKENVYKSNAYTQFIVKGNYRISDILSVRENPARFIPLCVANRSIIETSFEVAQKIRPVWHLPEDKKVIGDYKIQDQEQ